jgi:hypothetical protein
MVLGLDRFVAVGELMLGDFLLQWFNLLLYAQCRFAVSAR